MQYTETQLEAIKMFGRKDLSFGCIFSGHEYVNHDLWEELKIEICVNETESKNFEPRFCIGSEWKEYCIYEILWHIPHLEDLFRLAEEEEIIVEIREFPREEHTMITFQRHPMYKQFPYIRSKSLLDQPNLSDIISLFR